MEKVLILVIICSVYKDTVSDSLYGNKIQHQKYDYVIVGGGSAGSVIASRLSEDNGVQVLLLEAGGPPPLLADIPYYQDKLKENPDTNWDYRTEPQENACESEDGKRCSWRQYKALGGCSSHNGMAYVRGSPSNYNNWVKLGATGWGWRDVLPFFIKSEDNRDPKLSKKGYHGTGGYLTVSPLSYKTRLRDAYLQAGKSLGYKMVDYNAPKETVGFSDIQLTIRDGRRCSTEKAFLRPALNRPNLDILPYAQVLKIQFDKHKRARSVVYSHENQTLTVAVRKEVILSAGAIGSPKLLMLSGVGPKEHLQELGIPVIADLPVGQNLHDHVLLRGQEWQMNQSVQLNNSLYQEATSIADFQEGKGPLTTPGGVEVAIFVNSKYQNPTDNWPDIQIMAHTPVGLSTDLNKKSTTSLLPFILKPKSRGFLKLRSKDPYVYPIMQPQYLTEEEDRLALVEALKIGRKIMKTDVFQSFGAEPNRTAVSGCSNWDWDSEEYINCVLRYASGAGLHIVGTAKMGKPRDPTTVVDPELRVKGVKGLRVADASVMPQVTNGNTNAVCIMIGEKAAHMISSKP